MYEHNQLFIADSFAALFTVNGRPTLERKELEGRYEACEDLAQQLAGVCMNLQLDDDPSTDAALRQCLEGVHVPSMAGTEAESRWVIRRVAELLDWPVPGWLASSARSGSGSLIRNDVPKD
jgi:hypothetical protein